MSSSYTYCDTRICLPEEVVKSCQLAVDMINEYLTDESDVCANRTDALIALARADKLEHFTNQSIAVVAARIALGFAAWRTSCNVAPDFVGFVLNGDYPNVILSHDETFDDDAAAKFFHIALIENDCRSGFGFETSTSVTTEAGEPNSGFSWFVTKDSIQYSDQRSWMTNVQEDRLHPLRLFMVCVLVVGYDEPRCGVYRAMDSDEAVKYLLADKYAIAPDEAENMVSNNTYSDYTFVTLQCDDITLQAVQFTAMVRHFDLAG